MSSKKISACVACGSAGNISLIQLGRHLAACRTCCGEARKLLSLSPDDLPATVAAKLLALRSPCKEASVIERMSKKSWQKAAQAANGCETN